MPFQDLASRYAAVKLSTYICIPAAHSHSNLWSAGSPSTTPLISKAVAKELNQELQDCGWVVPLKRYRESKSQMVALHHGNFQNPQRNLLSSVTLLFFCSIRTMCFSGKGVCQLLMLPLTRCSVHAAPASPSPLHSF